MEEYLDEAKEELKRADHLIFVSLKYTRTVDILRHTLERLISTYDNIWQLILNKAKDEELIEEISVAPGKICSQIKDIHDDKEELIIKVDFYLFLRKLHRADFDRSQEYRRHVTMTSHLEDNDFEVNIDVVHEYYEDTKKFIIYIEDQLLKLPKDD